MKRYFSHPEKSILNLSLPKLYGGPSSLLCVQFGIIGTKSSYIYMFQQPDLTHLVFLIL